MSEPLAYFITWTTYGTWLPGDPRGWVKEGSVEIEAGDAETHLRNYERLKQSPVVLSIEQ